MTIFKLTLAALLCALPAQARPRTPRPTADALILKALSGPATGYRAVERVQVFMIGKKPKAVKANLSVLPGGRIRREVLPAKKTAVPLVLIRDGRDDETPETGLARLRGLYEMTVSTGGVVAKRRTWKIELRLSNGLLRRVLWVDRTDGLLMKRETYRDDGSLARRERLIKLELPASIDSKVFAGLPPSGPWVPDGFVLTSDQGGRRRYTNGLETFEVTRESGRVTVSGDLAEDDEARVREAAR